MARRLGADGRVSRRTHDIPLVPAERDDLVAKTRLCCGIVSVASARETVMPLRVERNLYLSWAAKESCPDLLRRHWLVSLCFAPMSTRRVYMGLYDGFLDRAEITGE